MPFKTNAGYGTGSSFETVKKCALTVQSWKVFQSKADWKEMEFFFVMEGEMKKEAETKVKQWLQKIDIDKK